MKWHVLHISFSPTEVLKFETPFRASNGDIILNCLNVAKKSVEYLLG